MKRNKKKQALIGVGLSIALLGIVGTGVLSANHVAKKIDKNNSKVVENSLKDKNEKDVIKNPEVNTSKKEENNDKVKVDSKENITQPNVIKKPTVDESKVNKDSENNKVKEIEKETKKDNSVGQATKTNGSNLKDSAKAYAVNRHDVEKMVKGTYSGELKNQKTVFLTFDDGPSKNTPKVLDILNKYGVHGTFFMLGQEAKEYPEYVKMVYNQGNAIGNHSYSHNFSNLYPSNRISTKNFMDEYHKTENVFKDILGQNFNTKLVRMPGGENSREYYKDKNLPALKNDFKNESIASIDWNALNGDAEGKKYSVSEMVDYVKRSSKGHNDVVVLMHDANTKGTTVEALPQIIEYFKNQGYNFKVIS